MLYGSPVWVVTKKNSQSKNKLESVQRKEAPRITRAYKTVSKSAVLVLASAPPLAMERKEVYHQIKETTCEYIKAKTRIRLIERWENAWDRKKTGRWAQRLIPNNSPWVNWKHGEVSFFITQVLSGQGCFKLYLYRFLWEPKGRHRAYSIPLRRMELTSSPISIQSGGKNPSRKPGQPPPKIRGLLVTNRKLHKRSNGSQGRT